LWRALPDETIADLLARLMDLAHNARYIANQGEVFAGNLLDAYAPMPGCASMACDWR